MDDELHPPSLLTLRRRNSITTTVQLPTNLKPLQTATSLPNGSATSPPHDLDLIPLKSSSASYTSLKDILPSSSVALNSPTAAGSATNSGYEISIRNRLVKQAAWAYLQPMSASPDSSGTHFFRRVWVRFSSQNPISSCFSFFHLKILPTLTRLVNRILRSIGILFTK